MAQTDFTFNRVRDSDSRDSFIRTFADRSVKAPSSAGSGADSGAGGEDGTSSSSGDAGADGGASGGDSGASGSSGTRGGGSKDRAPLAPKNGKRVFAKVTGTRLNRLYRECRSLKIAKNENAAALLLRVFLELSSEAFLIEKSVPLPAKHTGKKADWSEVGISLDDKVNAVMPLIDTSARTKQQLKPARVALANKHGHGSIDTLHAYFHNLDMNPEAVGIRDAWDTWENYLALLHAARN